MTVAKNAAIDRRKTGRGPAGAVWGVCLLVIVLAAGAVPGAGAEGGTEPSPPLELSAGRDFYHLGPYVDVLPDPTGKLTLEEVRRPPLARNFKPNGKVMLRLGTVKGAVWLRFRLIERFPDPKRLHPWIVELSKEYIDLIDIYLEQPGGGYRVIRAGQSRPLHPGMVVSRTPALSVPPHLLNGSYIFIRLENRFGLGMTAEVRSPRAFQFHLLGDSYTMGALFGVPLALSLFNFFIFIFFRDRVYLYYVIFMLSMFGYQLMVHGQISGLQVFTLDTDLTIFGILAGLVMIFGAQFTRTFLLTPKNAPLWDKVLLVYMVLALVKTALSLAGLHAEANHMAQFMALLSPVLSIATGVTCWRRGYTPARFYLLAWTAFSLSVVWHVLVSLNLLPWSGLSALMMVVGSALEAILLSFALADRIRTIQKEQERLRRATRHYRQLSNMDSLTGLFNARYLRDHLEPVIEKDRRAGKPLSLMIIDVDDFKRFNDTYGHPEGDKVLTSLGMVIRECVRRADVPCRYGGEEFCIILPGANLEQAALVAERIRGQFESLLFEPAGKERPVTVTVSIGTARLAPEDNGAKLISAADKALYEAKSQGKNKVVLSFRSGESPA